MIRNENLKGEKGLVIALRNDDVKLIEVNIYRFPGKLLFHSHFIDL